MSKRVDTSGLDAGFIIGQAVKSNREQNPKPVQPPPEPPVVQEETAQPSAEPERETAPVIAAAEPVKEPEPPREEIRRRKAKADPQDYKTLFIHEAAITARSGKTVYISKEHHDRITKILQVIGKNEVSLFSYIYNVLEHHFSAFQEDMNELYESNLERKVF
jgi:hypothetical protein